jgi:hypothetical protein
MEREERLRGTSCTLNTGSPEGGSREKPCMENPGACTSILLPRAMRPPEKKLCWPKGLIVK